MFPRDPLLKYTIQDPKVRDRDKQELGKISRVRGDSQLNLRWAVRLTFRNNGNFHRLPTTDSGNSELV